MSLLGRVSHAGILFITVEPGKATENRLLRCSIKEAAGIGIGAFALKGGQTRLVIGHTRAEGGADTSALRYGDGGIRRCEGLGVRSGDRGQRRHGCMSQQGRNILAFAAAEGKARARIERSTSGESGQDGIIGVAAMVPATVEIEVRDSTIEKAAQMNLEGSILNLPPSDPGRAHEGLVSIDVERCVIRRAGFVDGFRGEAQNIWLAPSVLAKGPFARGRYRLAVRDSTVEKAIKGGIAVGNAGSDFKIAPDEGEYEVRLRGNTIRDNGTSEITIAAAKARVDARRNFWGTPSGLADGHVILLDESRRSQLDASEPLARPAERLRSR